MPRTVTIRENHGCYTLSFYSTEEMITPESVNELTLPQVFVQAKRFMCHGDRNKTLPYKKRGASNRGGNGQVNFDGNSGIQPQENEQGREIAQTEPTKKESWLSRIFPRALFH